MFWLIGIVPILQATSILYMKSDETTIQNVQNYRCNDSVFYCNGLPVCAMHERVNRYTVNFVVMLTTSATYGKMFLDRKGCGRRWIEALKERGYGWRLRVVCDWQQK